MLKWGGILMAFQLTASMVSAAEPVPSEITETVVFSNQALVKREATAHVREGLNELVLEVDAFQTDDDSVSAEIRGKGDIFSVQMKDIFLKEAPQENIVRLESQIKELKEQKTGIEDQKNVLDKETEFLNSVIDFSQVQVPKDIKTSFPKTEDLGGVLNFLRDNYTRIHDARRPFDRQIEELDKKIHVLEQELAALKRPARNKKKVIEVLFTSQAEQDIRIAASYVAFNALWSPLYKVSVPLESGDPDLTMFAQIQQRTGEDWKQASVTISNVVPLRGVGLPEPHSWEVDILQPQNRALKRSKMMAADTAQTLEAPLAAGAMNQLAEAPPMPEEQAGFTVSESEELPLSFEYKVPMPLDIESREKETIVPLFTKKLKGQFYHYAVPKLNPLTFYICRADADKELLSGPLNVYFGGRYVGKTFLEEKKAGESFDLNLGADRSVVTQREKITDKRKETAFFKAIERKTIERALAYKISVENLKDKPVTLKLLDSIPVAKTDKIEVKDVNISPKPTEQNYKDREGVLLWDLSLKPNEKKEITIEFAVSYPKDLPISGL